MSAAKMLTVKAAADLLGVSVSLVYGLCATKKLRHERQGHGRGAIRIPPEAVEEYRRRCTVGPAAPSVPPPVPTLNHLSLA